MVTLIRDILWILRLQVHVVQGFTHVDCRLDAITRFFLRLFYHYIVS